MSYFNEALITDLVIIPFKIKNSALWDAVLLRTDSMAVDLAEQVGVGVADIKTPLCTHFSDLLRAYFCFNICLDATEVANLDQGAQDKYMTKFGIYKSMFDREKKALTKEMIMGAVATRGDRAFSGILYHT